MPFFAIQYIQFPISKKLKIGKMASFSQFFELNLSPSILRIGVAVNCNISSLAKLAFVVELLWLGPGWVALVFGNHNNPPTVHICKFDARRGNNSRTVHVKLTFPKRPKTTVPMSDINHRYYRNFVYVFGACALPSSGHLLLGFQNDGESSILAIPIEKETEVDTTISVTDTVHVGAMQVCRSPRRGANSIRRIGVSENDIIFCNPILSIPNFKEIENWENDIVFAY